jgi:O-antigen chain-terminating methyltransferase
MLSNVTPRVADTFVDTQRINGLAATFKTAPLDLNTVSTNLPGEYDVALALSVLHHITLRRGIDNVKQLVAELLACIPILVVELAHRDEGVNFAWRESLPEDPLGIFSACPHIRVHRLGDFSSHLSSSVRPMYLITR